MFDKYLVSPGPSVQRVQIENKVDPTEAAKLYADLRREAEDEALKLRAFQLGAVNTITDASIDREHKLDTGETMYRVAFMLNGELIKLQTTHRDFHQNIAREVLTGIVTEFCRQFGDRVLKGR